MRDQLITGSWLNAERLRRYPAIVLILLLTATVLLAATARGERDAYGRPLGTDFGEVWIAGLEVDRGAPTQPYDNAAHFAAQRERFGTPDAAYVWPYPPYFLGVAALLATLPYIPALVLWQLTTLGAYLGSILAALRPARLPIAPTLVAALAFPAVFINLAHGQNGFLTTALLAGGLLALPARPLVAGLIFALLAYKPHFGLVVPVALLAAGHWRTFAAASVGGVTMTLATLVAFGTAPWLAFFAGAEFTRATILEQGALGFEKVQSVFAAVRLIGGPVALAYALQAATTGAALAAVAWVWRCRVDFRLKAATLIVAALLATPYVLDYDMVALAPALAFAISYGMEKGFGPYEKTGLALVWAVPLFARVLAALGLPIGVFVMAGFLAGLVHRALRERLAQEAGGSAQPGRI